MRSEPWTGSPEHQPARVDVAKVRVASRVDVLASHGPHAASVRNDGCEVGVEDGPPAARRSRLSRRARRWQGGGLGEYPSATAGLYTHVAHNLTGTGAVAHKVLPGVHRVASFLNSWLLGTHQGGVKPEHLAAYLDEFSFRFNRRRSGARGLLFYRLLEQAVQSPPRTYDALVAKPGRKKPTTPTAPTSRASPRSLVRPPGIRPWRA